MAEEKLRSSTGHPTPSDTGTSSTVYSAQEIRNHSLPDDLWMTIHGKVYDVTNFATEHPGGVEVLLDCGGVDASEAFDDVAHSDLAHEMLAPYLVGCIETADSKNQGAWSGPDREKAGLKSGSKRKDKLSDLRRQRVAVMCLTGMALVSIVVVMLLQKIQWVSLIHR